MASPDPKPSFSLSAFVEQAAQMLRNAAKVSGKKKRKVSKEDGLSHMNKIKQIARMLRDEVEKIPRRKKKNR